MPWFTKTKKEIERKPAKEDIWIRCESCNAHVFKEDWCNNLKVCPKCNYHAKLTAFERVEYTLDQDTFKEMFETITSSDPLHFVYNKGSYADRISEARINTRLNEAVITGIGQIDKVPVAVSIMDFRFLGGSLGSATGEKIFQMSVYAASHRIPYLIFSASGGARMHEGTLSLMQMAKTCSGIARFKEKGIPYISILTDPTTGGVSASFAMVGDINIAEPGALVGFAGRRVIEQTIKQKLPDNFQTAEYFLEHGFIDMIVERKDLKVTLKKILSYCSR
jgi:acetyl-CoA carboxylase carboxyl transferase subunit beta